MQMMPRLLAATAASVAIAVPAAAQAPYPYPYPQTYPQTYPPAYPGYQQPYGGNVVGQIINQLLGNRYSVTDRGLIERCASASMVRAASEYRGYSAYGQQGYGGYPQGYGGYGQGIVPPNMRITAITNVERRNNGLRVSGVINSGMYGGYGGAYGQPYGNPSYAWGDLSFRCNVDYRGVVSSVRIRRNRDYRGY